MTERSGGRIGKIKACWHIPANAPEPQFRLVREGGKVVLGCWRAVGRDMGLGPDDDVLIPPRVIFERIS